MLLGLSIRLLHLFDLQRLPLFDRPTVDAALYVDMARRLAESFRHPEVFFKPPLYPYLLGACWRLAGENYFLLRLPGVFLGAATCGLTWLLGRRLFGPRVALVAGFLYAFDRTAVYFEGELLEIGLVTCVQTLALWQVLRASRCAARSRDAWLAGLALGAGCLARPTFLLFALVAVVWLARGASGTPRVRGAFGAPARGAATLAGLALAILPVTLHNAAHGHDFVLVSSNLGLNFYLGNNPQASGRMAASAELPANPEAARRDAQSLAEAAAGHKLRPSQVSGYWLRRGLAYDASHPGRALELLGRKLFYAWNATEISDNEDLSGLSRYLRVYRLLPVGMWLLAPLGLVGLVAAPWRRVHVDLVRLFVAAQILALLPFFLVGRFRLPWVPALAVFAAWSLLSVARLARERSRGALRLAAGIAAAALFCNLPAFGVRAAVDFDLDYKIGYAYQQRGRYPEALAAYRRSIEQHPQSALARNALGLLLAEQGQSLEEAAQSIRAAIQLDPARAAHYYESLAQVELRLGSVDGALEACTAGLAATPEASTRFALLERRAEAQRASRNLAAEAATLREAIAAAPAGATTDAARRRLAEIAAQLPPPRGTP